MRLLSIILLPFVLVSCMETDARILQLEREKADLEKEVDALVDSIDVLFQEKELEIINLNATIQMKDNSFDSLMLLWNDCLTDTTYLDTLKARLQNILETYN